MSPSKQEGDSRGRFWTVTLGGHSRCSIFTFGGLRKVRFFFFLSFRIGLEVLPAVHATISTFLKIFLPLPFSFGFFLSFSLFLPLSIPFMHLFGFSLFPFNFQLSKEFHCQFVHCLFKQLRVILHICGLSFLI